MFALNLGLRVTMVGSLHMTETCSAGTDRQSPAHRLLLVINPDQGREFYPIFQQGVTVTARLGCSVAELLSDQFGLSGTYVAERITTIFLNGKAIDDVNTAIVKAGSTLALSGAMPGLVGATMRRGGYYAAMRSGISHIESDTGTEGRIGPLRVKLFNILLPELGPEFLRRGVQLAASDLAELFANTTEALWAGCSAARLDGEPVSPELLRSGEAFAGGGAVRLVVNLKG